MSTIKANSPKELNDLLDMELTKVTNTSKSKAVIISQNLTRLQ